MVPPKAAREKSFQKYCGLVQKAPFANEGVVSADTDVRYLPIGGIAMVLRRADAELLLEAFGKIGRVVKPYFQCDLRHISEFAFNEFRSFVQSRPFDQLMRRLTDQGFNLLEKQ
jgi:hypothetical protein